MKRVENFFPPLHFPREDVREEPSEGSLQVYQVGFKGFLEDIYSFFLLLRSKEVVL